MNPVALALEPVNLTVRLSVRRLFPDDREPGSIGRMSPSECTIASDGCGLSRDVVFVVALPT